MQSLVFSKRLLRKEFGSRPKEADLAVVRKCFLKGVCVPIGGAGLPKSTELVKIYATSVWGARRIVFLVDESTRTAFFLFYRSKNDAIGSNVTIRNPEFKRRLREHLRILSEDIANWDVVEEPRGR